MIICDSGSTDESRGLLENFAATDERVHFYNIPKEGIYPGWNDCLKRAHGKYIYIATADDLFSADLLSSMVSYLEQYPFVDLAYCRLKKFNAEGAEDDKTWNNQPIGRYNSHLFDHTHLRKTPWELCRSYYYGHPSISINQMLIRYSLFEKTGYFPTDMGPSGDVLWHLRALRFSDLMYVQGPFAGWRIHDAQASTSDGRLSAKQCQICRERFIDENLDIVSRPLRRGMALSRWHLLRRKIKPFQTRSSFREALDMLFVLGPMGYALLKKIFSDRKASFTVLVAGDEVNSKGIKKILQ